MGGGDKTKTTDLSIYPSCYFCVYFFFDKYCMYKEFTSYIFSVLYFVIMHYFFVEK